MMIPFETLLLGISVLLLVSIVASKASGRLGVPSLLFFLLVGMLAGSEGIGGIYFDDPQLAQSVGVLALIMILFSGGLDTRWALVRPIVWRGLSLATLGVFTTCLLLGSFTAWFLRIDLLEGLLLGAIVASTDAAAVFAILRSRGVSLQGHIAPLIEFESGSNDPMAVFLTTAVIGLLTDPSASVLGLVPLFIRQMILGALLGYLGGRGVVVVVNRIRLEYDGLYPVLTVALVLFIYGATAVVGGNGFLAVYIAGLVIGNLPVIHQRSLMRFHDGLAWLMQISMFLVLGLLVFPSELPSVILPGLVVSAFLILVARPVSVFLGLSLSKMELRPKLMVSWVGLRGAVPVILATFPLLAGVEQADLVFNMVFFIVLTSVLVQGTTIPPVARLLGVDAPLRARPRAPLEFERTEGMKGDLIEMEVEHGALAVGKRIVDLNLPRGALFVLVGKGEHFFVPSGSTVLEEGDVVTLLVDAGSLPKVYEALGLPEEGTPA